MADTAQFEPRWLSAPGETLNQLLQERRLSREAFAQRIGCTAAHTTQLLDGTAPITAEVASRLSSAVGGSAEFWTQREAQFREDLNRLRRSEGAEWLNELPVDEMLNFSWIEPSISTDDQVLRCLNFFGVHEIESWRDRYIDGLRARAFKTSPSIESQPAAVATWLRKAELESIATNCDVWSAERFSNALSDIRRLTRQRRPDVFVPKLKERCAECGVAVVILRAPTGCRASGATWFLSPKKAIIVLSFRYLSDDHFWFTFFHEAGHLLLHEHTKLFLEGADVVCTEQEQQANEFAATTLIPARFEAELLRLPLDGHAVIRFARKIGIAPGIVVGQLQHRGNFTHRQLNSLKTRFQWTTG